MARRRKGRSTTNNKEDKNTSADENHHDGDEKKQAQLQNNEMSAPVDNTVATESSVLSDDDNELGATTTNDVPSNIEFALEAIFHPKFENEAVQEKSIRSQMKKRVAEKQGYLEVSLKHSGTLLLWSGGQQAYFSKNSTSNGFTYVGEAVLRQHFARAWYNHRHQQHEDGKQEEEKKENNNNNNHASMDPEYWYNKCSDYLQKHRLTCAFELVTSVLGHHGDLPRHDYLVLTAVADKSRQTFLSTAQVVRLAHIFRLPHNDVWIISDRATDLFDLYDTSRETALADTLVERLTEISNVYLASMYPHKQFQGNILEGIVIRHVEYPSSASLETNLDLDVLDSKQSTSDTPPPMAVVQPTGDQDNKSDNHQGYLQHLQQLADASQNVLKHLVPISRPSCHDLDWDQQDSLFGTLKQEEEEEENDETKNDNEKERLQHVKTLFKTNIRALFEEECRLGNFNNLTNRLGDAILERLKLADGGRRRTTVKYTQRRGNSQQQASKKQAKQPLPLRVSVFQMARAILDSPCQTMESRRIAQVLIKAKRFQRQMILGIFQETLPDSEKTRWICIVHVLQDYVFARYQKSMKPSDMHLFRGFSFEIKIGSTTKEEETVVKKEQESDSTEDKVADTETSNDKEENKANTTKNSDEEGTGDEYEEDDHDSYGEEDWDISNNSKSNERLMLKMKLLPYMVRTFCCRNGLKTIETGGPQQFISYTRRMLKKWGMSQEAISKWQPYFYAWGHYVTEESKKPQQQGNAKKAKRKKNNANQNDSLPATDTMPPMNSSFYLIHIQRFEKLYNEGKYKKIVNQYFGKQSDNKESVALRPIIIVTSPFQAISEKVGNLIAQNQKSSQVKHQFNGSIESSDFDGDGPLVYCVTLKSSLLQQVKSIFDDDNFDPNGIEYGKAIVIVMADCDSYPDRKIKNMAKNKFKEICKQWKSLGVAKVLTCWSPALFPDGDNKADTGETPATTENSESDQLLKQISDFSNSLRQKPLLASRKSSGNDIKKNKPGLLVFFPGIPGCGKSTLSSESTIDEIQKAIESDASASLTRKVQVLHGDSCKKKYWPTVKNTRKADASPVFIADKNAPATAWGTFGVGDSIGFGYAVPVIPNDSALCTTTIHGTTSSTGPRHVYPFSLSYLAVCMARVLSRPPNSHAGKLDLACEAACLVVVKFYSLYRNLTAEEFLGRIHSNVASAGGECLPEPLVVSFFKDDNHVDDALPSEVEEALTDAIRMQFRFDKQKKRKDPSVLIGKDEEVKKMERRLRDVIKRNRDALFALTVEPETSKREFVSSLCQAVGGLDTFEEEQGRAVATPPKVTQEYITLVSIDVPRKELHAKLLRLAEQDTVLKQALQIFGLPGKKTQEKRLVVNTHVTMVHCSQSSQEEIHQTFDHMIGASVPLQLTGLYWNKNVAAIGINLPETIATVQDKAVTLPASQNDFCHITLWVGPHGKAVDSNQLPQDVQSQRGNLYVFSNEVSKEEASDQSENKEPLIIQGTMAYWTGTKSSQGG